MKPRIEGTRFGSITFECTVFEYDVVTRAPDLYKQALPVYTNYAKPITGCGWYASSK